MKRSVDRILTTHVGSLIRPQALQDIMRAKQGGQSYDRAAYEACLAQSIAEVVRRQAEVGLDVISDGEFGKAISWNQYVVERLSGFELRAIPPGLRPGVPGADRTRFKEFYAELDVREPMANDKMVACVGPVGYVGQEIVRRDIANFKAALASVASGQRGDSMVRAHSASEDARGRADAARPEPGSSARAAGVRVEEAFMPVVAPSSVLPDRKDEYYKGEEDWLEAVTAAMRTEYRMIVDAGFVLQIDDARAATAFDRMVPPASFEDYRRWLAKFVESLNHALDGIPEDRVRYHVCWGSWPGPHVSDVPLGSIVDLILKVRAGAYVIESANPRHEHEWQVWKTTKLPDGKVLIPGVISHATNVVEHPELVAERILRFAKLLGRENVMAGTDCGFAQGTFYRRVHPTVMWAKFEALVEGARLASKQLWN
ncbi:MAG: cobalamin-independent methionine synthase II family protein [Xanthobacteraceae bacterium]